jgi:WD40 repeat protein
MADGAQDSGSTVLAGTDQLKVFISYSRDDLEFADQLVAALKLCGFVPTLDRHSISGGEAWKQRLGALMLEADTVVFVLSPASVRSEICAWEVEEADRLGKRILPVLSGPLGDTSAPDRLGGINHIFFYSEARLPGSGFGSGLAALVSALNTDLGWIREHTRLLERATEWHAGGCPVNRLLSGNDIANAKAWAGRRPKDAPEPTAMHLEYIRASEEQEMRRADAERKRLEDMAAAQEERAKALKAAEEALRNAAEAQKAQSRARAIIAWGSAAAALILAVVATWAVIQSRETARQEKLAKEALFEIQITRSRLLLDAAKKQAQEGDQVAGLLLALEAAPDPKAMLRPTALLITAQQQLADSLNNMRERKVLQGHTDRIWSVAVTPDGRRIVTGAWGAKPARVWDLKTGAEILELKGHKRDVNGVAVTPDGTRLVTASDDNTARIWEAGTGKELRKLEGHTKIVYAVAVSPDSARIVTGSADNTARVWDAATGKLLVTFDKHKGSVLSVAVTPDGRRIISGTGGKDRGNAGLWVWNADTGDELLRLDGHTDDINGIAITPDGSRIVTASDDNTVRVWDMETGKEMLRLKGEGRATAVAVTRDGSQIIGALHNTVRIWDSRTGNVLGDLKGHSDAIRGLVLTPDGRTIVTASNDTTVRIWDAQPSLELVRLKGHTKRLWGVAISPDGRHVVTGAWGEAPARLWDAHTGAEIRRFDHRLDVNGVAVTSDGARIVTTSDDMKARIWDASTGKELHQLEGHANIVYGVAASPDGKRIVTGAADKTALVWDSNGRLQRKLTGHTNEINVATFSADSTRILTGSDDKTIRVWNAATGAELLRLQGHTAAVFGVAVSPDGSRIVSGSVDGTARIWDAATGAELIQLKGHTGAVFGVAVTPDGSLVVTGSKDNTARIWDAKTGAELHRLSGHSGPVFGVAISSDGNRIVTGSGDGTARIWDLAALRPQFSAPQNLVTRAKNDVPRCLTIQQRQAFSLAPEPPPWCIEMAKYPYHPDAWRTKGATDPKIAGAFDDFATRALRGGDFPKALDASELGLRFNPDDLLLKANQAHASMFLGKTEEARTIYLAHRGRKLRRSSWEELVRRDFEELRSRGLKHDLMTQMEKSLIVPPPDR